MMHDAANSMQRLHRVCAVCDCTVLECQEMTVEDMPQRFLTALVPPLVRPPHPELRALYDVSTIARDPRLATVMLSPRGVRLCASTSVAMICVCHSCMISLNNEAIPAEQPPRFAIANYLFFGWPE